MSWDDCRTQWQHGKVPPMDTTIDEVMQRAARLHRTLRLRDLRETVAAALLLPFASAWVWAAWTEQAWARLGFAGLLLLWLFFVPWHLWRARRRLPSVEPQQSLSVFLRAQRHALLMQAALLKGAWFWYVAPCTIGLVGMSLARHGITHASLIHVLPDVLLGVVVAALNRYAARKTLHPRIEAIDRQLQMLAVDDTQLLPPNQDDPS